MVNITYLIIYYLFLLLFSKSNTLKCGEKEIENCLQCGSGVNNNTCIKCIDKYLLFDDNNTNRKCYYCLYEIKDCEKCHYNLSNSKIICDKCLDGYKYNINENKCESNNCEDYPEISEGCIICDEKCEKYISNKKCHKCKPTYFKTKNEKCINCKSDNYGGSGCLKCKYALDNNNVETNDIICDI